MAQIIFYGNINQYAYVCVQDELHRTIRYRQVFRQDNHLLAMANDSPTSPEGKCYEVMFVRVHVIVKMMTIFLSNALPNGITPFLSIQHMRRR